MYTPQLPDSPRLVFGNHDVDELLDAYGSPLYIYDFEILRDQIRILRQALPDHIDIYYAVKSNPNPAIIAEISAMHCGCDVASLGEILAARRAGVSPDQILFTGPGKTDVEIDAALSQGVHRFNAESETEIQRISAAAGRHHRTAQIGLRINTDYAIQETRTIIGGTDAKKFGVDENLAADIITRCQPLRNIQFTGIHVFNATQVLNYNELAANTANILRLAVDLVQGTGIKLTYVDIGGGLGIPYSPDEAELDVVALGKEFEKLSRRYEESDELKNVRWIVEPGRFISGPCGVLVCRVTEIKESRGVKFLITDAGIQHFLRPALVGQSHPVRLANKLNQPATVEYRIEGPLCTSLDVMSPKALLPEATVGDVVVFYQAGAYGYTESMPFFLSHPWPAEVAVDGKTVRLIRKRIEPGQWMEMSLP